MSIYIPEGWALIEKEGVFWVFGSWVGGYAGSDHWRINSGIISYEETEDEVKFFGSSGSSYVCRKVGEGRLSMYNRGVFENALEYNDANHISFEEFKRKFKEE